MNVTFPVYGIPRLQNGWRLTNSTDFITIATGIRAISTEWAPGWRDEKSVESEAVILGKQK